MSVHVHESHIACCAVTPVHAMHAAHMRLPLPGATTLRPRHPQVRRIADLLVLGKVVTGVPGAPEAEGIAISDGVITGVGSKSDLDGLVGPDTQIITEADGVISPGLIEPHMHIWTTMLVEDWASMSALDNPTFDDVKARVKKVADSTPDGEWVFGKLFDPSLYDGEPDLTASILDTLSPDKPVFIYNASMHFAYVNSKAMEMAGITYETPDPDGGKIGRADGKLTGVLSEAPAIQLMLPVLPLPGMEQAAGIIMKILNKAASVGVTSVREAATGAVLGPNEFGLLQQLNTAMPFPVRVSTAQWALVGADAWKEAGVTPFTGDDMVRADAWKIITDGSNQGRSGYFLQPYLNENNGAHANLTPEQVLAMVNSGLDDGWQLMVHANGDAAVEFALEAYEKALPGRQDNDLRHRMEHVSFAFPHNFDRMARLGVSPSFLMNHVYYWGRVFRDNILGPERANRLDMVRSALNAGLRPSLHSDYNVTEIHPLLSAQTAVRRVMYGTDEVLNPDECVTPDQALTAITTDAAWQIHADNRGTLEVGKLADFTILSDNPWSSDPEGWHEITASQTWVGGRMTYSA